MTIYDDDINDEPRFQPPPRNAKVKTAMPKAQARIRTTELSSPLDGWHDLVIGQAQFASAVEPAIKRHLAGLGDPNRPVGVWLLAGPTGTGKTKSVETLAEVLHGSARNLIRLDCGEFQMEHEIAKLIGAPPGYLGHRETQPLLTTMKLNATISSTSPISILLLDELEKASDSFHRLLLGIMDSGRLRLGDNTTVDFTKTLICATTNLAADKIQRASAPALGFAGVTRLRDGGARPAIASLAVRAAKNSFAPEFVNRLDGIIAFHALSRDDAKHIARIELTKALARPTWMITCDDLDQLVELVVEDGFSVEYGAREIKRSVERLVMGPLADYTWRLDKQELCVRVRVNDGAVEIAHTHGKVASAKG